MTTVGILVGLAGISVSLMCLLAFGDGVYKRALIGVLSGLALTACGAWMAGLLS